MGLKDFFSKASKAKSTANARQKIERAPRVKINALHAMEFAAREPRFSSPLFIENISASGVGLIMPSDADLTSLDVIMGDLRIGDTTYPLVLRVVRFNGDNVGTRIENPTPNFLSALNKYFESEIAAIKLKATRADFLKAVPHGTPHWYQGSNNCDLSYVSSGAEVVEFACTIFGNHIEGLKGQPLRLSAIAEQKLGETARHKGSELLEPMSKPDPMLVTLAKRVVMAVEDLPADHRDAILSYLN